MKSVVIIGGMAAGCKTAARLKRINPDYNVTIIEKLPFISFGTCGMPYYASGEVDDFYDLAKTPWGISRNIDYFKNSKGVDVLTETEAINIEPEKNLVECLNLKTNQKFELNYDELVIATGAGIIKPSFPCPVSDRIMTFHNPNDAKKVRQLAQSGKIETAAIIGGGYIGCELAEALTTLWGIQATIIEKEDRLLPHCLDLEISNILENVYTKNSVNLFLNKSVSGIELKDDINPIINLIDGNGIEADIIFICTGVKPRTALPKAIGIETGKYGGILVNEAMQTNIPNIWAAGDCVEIKNLITGSSDYFPLGSLANRQGKVIADNIAGLQSRFEGSVGSISMKVFGLITASAGLSETRANELSIACKSICGTFYDRPDYHPDNKTLYAKIVYEHDTMRLLGLQLAGEGEVTRYIDIFSLLLKQKCTAYDLLDVEHAYNPPHSSPMNPLNFLGSMIIAQETECIIAVNPSYFDGAILNINKNVIPAQAGIHKPLHIDSNISGSDSQKVFRDTSNIIFLDVREGSEIANSPFDYPTTHIPSGELRERIIELDKNKQYIILCQKGPRAYEAARYLKNNGFNDVYYLAGGVQMWNI